MKNIKKLIYSAVCLIAFAACTEEYDKDVVLQATTNQVAQLSMVGEFAPGASVAFTVTLPEAYSKKATITVSAISSELVTTTGTVTIDASETTASGRIILPASSGTLGGFGLKPGFITAGVAGIELLDEVDNDGTIELVPASDDTFTLTSNTVSLDCYSLLPGISTSGSFSYLLDWDDPIKYDIDLQVIDRAFTAILESSESGDRYESDFFNNSHPDGDYDFYFRIYAAGAVTAEDINFVLFTVLPDGTRNKYEGIILAGSSTGGARIDFASLTKTGDDYTFVID